MKKLVQYFRSGELELIDSPIPKCNSQDIVIESLCSLISVGTEKMLINFGKASLINKAKQQPEKVREVLNKVKNEGLLSTFEAVWTKLNEPIPLGYSNVGKIIEIGNSVQGFKIGDKVISNGAHAEFVRVPWTLAAKIPESVTNEEASFAVIGSIALQGIRLLKPSLGETIVVIGMGLLGQLTAQIAQANGCRVIGIDIDADKIQLARKLGIEAIISGSMEGNINYILGATNGMGSDGVIITASSTSEEILSQSALISRKRGRIVLIGVIPITVPRNLFYEKELTFQVSSAYGPGRYDPLYEEKGIDYPLPYVRWTAKRNMEAFLFLLEQRNIKLEELITHRFKFENVFEAYKTINNKKPLGIVLSYIGNNKQNRETYIIKSSKQTRVQRKYIENINMGFIGAGNFAKMVLLPAIKSSNTPIKIISSLDGYDGVIASKLFDISQITSDNENIFQDENINTIFIATRHNSHASLAIRAIESNKNVFVEKPMAMNIDELKQIYIAINNHNSLKLTVGFNRRFSPFSQKLYEKLQKRSDPISIIITVNAGAIPINHWVHDPEIGGGRIIGEVCHFVDLARFLVGSQILNIGANSTFGHSQTDQDKILCIISFADGSQAAINYLSNGNKRFQKERVEIFSSGRIFSIDNFKKLKSFGGSLRLKTIKQDKGHKVEIHRFIESVKKDISSPIPLEQIFEVHLATFAIQKSLEKNQFIHMNEMWDKIK